MKILVGADPELFMVKDGQFVWPTNEIPGNKKSPYKIEGGAVQIDGAALEFNIDPAEDAETFDKRIQLVMDQLLAMLPSGYSFSEGNNTATFDVDYYQSLPAELKVVGCDPDWDAYSERENKPMKESAVLNTRFAGGHVHVGWTENENVKDYSHLLSCISLAKQLDYYVSLPGLLYDRQPGRRQFYGRMGQFRPKPYGVEYRTPSNWWIWKSETRQLMFEQVAKAFNDLVMLDKDIGKQQGNIAADYSRNSMQSDYFREHIPIYINQLGVMKDSRFKLPRTDTFNGYRVDNGYEAKVMKGAGRPSRARVNPTFTDPFDPALGIGGRR